MPETVSDTRYLIIACSRCGTRNRVEESRIYDQPVCGKCRSPLSGGTRPTGTIVAIDDHTFDMVVSALDDPVVVDCWAPGCRPCKKIAPALDTLAAQYAGRVNILRLNVDDNPVTARRFNIRNIPTLLYFKNGRNVNATTGAVPKAEIERQMVAIL